MHTSFDIFNIFKMAATRISLQVYLINRKWKKTVPKTMAFDERYPRISLQMF